MRVHNPRGRAQVSNQQERRGARSAPHGSRRPEHPPDPDGRGRAQDAVSSSGLRATPEKWATRFGEGLRRGTHLHSLHSSPPHTLQQVGLTKDLNDHKYEPKAHSHSPPDTHTHTRAHTRAHSHTHPEVNSNCSFLSVTARGSAKRG